MANGGAVEELTPKTHTNREQSICGSVVPTSVPKHLCNFYWLLRLQRIFGYHLVAENMIRAPLVKALGALGSPTHQMASRAVRTSAMVAQTPAKAPEKIEVFVDDIPVQVVPGTTVLQVGFQSLVRGKCLLNPYPLCPANPRLLLRSAWRYPDSATTNVLRWPATAGCASSRWRRVPSQWPPALCP